jgi:hypothetical protein
MDDVRQLFCQSDTIIYKTILTQQFNPPIIIPWQLSPIIIGLG